jgi:putative oxidoreductase
MAYAADTFATVGRPSKGLHLALWAVQIVLGLMFVATGAMKVAQPIDKVIAMFVWPGAVAPALVRFIGLAEFLGGVGLIVPAATRIAPWLTPLAGATLALVTILATLFHLSRGEVGMLPVTVITGALMAFVAWGRSHKAPIVAR